jgi:hypothetical protein
LQFAVHFNHRLFAAALCVSGLLLVILLAVSIIGGVVRDIPTANDLALHDARVAVFVCLHEINRLAFVQGKEQLLGDGIVAVILLEDLQVPAGIERAQKNGIGLEVRGDIYDLYVVRTGLQIKR